MSNTHNVEDRLLRRVRRHQSRVENAIEANVGVRLLRIAEAELRLMISDLEMSAYKIRKEIDLDLQRSVAINAYARNLKKHRF